MPNPASHRLRRRPRRLLVRPHEHALVLLVGLLRSIARRHLTLFRFAARHGGRLSARSGAPSAVRAAVRAYRRVPAYRAHLDAAGGLPARPRGMSAQAWLSALPTTSKASYVDAHPVAARCEGGRLPAGDVEVDESSGSSGTPYQWVRSRAELEEVHVTLALLARYLLGERGGFGRASGRASGRGGRPVVTLNAFSMGAWSTGVNVSAALRRLGAIKSCGPEPEKVLAALELFGTAPRYVVCGYPPFLAQLAKVARERGVDLAHYDLTGCVGGEGMGEGLRAELEHTFRRVWSAYGASDLDIGVATETPVTVWLRQAAAADPELARALFGRTGRLPMIFQYDPGTYHVETIDTEHGRELVATVLRPTLTPKLRYRVGDSGGTLALKEALRIAVRLGHDPAGRPDPELDVFDLPLLYLHGRADSTISFMGANLYPEDVRAGLEDAVAAGDGALEGVELGAFCLELAGDVETCPRVHVERAAGAGSEGDPALAATLAAHLRDRLSRNSADYRAALAEDPRAGRLDVRLHAPGTGPFTANAGRIKRRYVLTH